MTKLAATEPTSAQFYGDTEHKHEAYGMISVNRLRSSGTVLFDSDLTHNEIITLEVFSGRLIDNDGQQRPARSSRTPMVSVSLSSAQWATLVSSFGLGDGVPCTITRKTDGVGHRVNPIKRVESTRQRFDRNIEEATQRQLDKLSADLNFVKDLAVKGKAGKRELLTLLHSMSSNLANLPANLSFSTQLMQEAMDNIVAAGKTEIEATAVGVAMRLGINEIGRLAELENKTDE